MSLFSHERFQTATGIVKEFAAGYCIDQSEDSDKHVWEMWLVGRTFVMITAKQNDGSRHVQVEVWAPVSNSNQWREIRDAVAELQTKT